MRPQPQAPCDGIPCRGPRMCRCPRATLGPALASCPTPSPRGDDRDQCCSLTKETVVSRKGARACGPTQSCAAAWQPPIGFIAWNKTDRECKPGELTLWGRQGSRMAVAVCTCTITYALLSQTVNILCPIRGRKQATLCLRALA